MKKLILIPLLFYTLSLFGTTRSEYNIAKLNAQLVLDKLYKANGNYIFLKPKLIVKDTKRKVAAYLPFSRTIILELEA